MVLQTSLSHSPLLLNTYTLNSTSLELLGLLEVLLSRHLATDRYSLYEAELEQPQQSVLLEIIRTGTHTLSQHHLDGSGSNRNTKLMQLIPYIASLITEVIVPKWGSIPWIWPCWTIWPWGGTVGAAYDRATKTIYLCNEWMKNRLYYNHELAHHAWFYLLTDIERSRYQAKWEACAKIGWRVFWRDYGSLSYWEWFADDFMYLTGSIYEDRASNPSERIIRNQRLAVVKMIASRLTRLANNQ